MRFNNYEIVCRRFFASFREQQLYRIKKRTEMPSQLVDQINFIPIRPLEPNERPSWLSPILKGKEVIARLKHFSVAKQ